MLAELGMVLTKPRHPLADRAGDADSSTLGRRGGPSVAAMEADRARELSNEEVALRVCLRLSLGVLESARLLDVILDLGEAPPVRVLRSCVEHLAGIARTRARQAGDTATVGPANRAAFGGDEVEHVELTARVGEQPREVPDALEVSHSHRAPLEDHRPVVALPAKHVEAGHGQLLRSAVPLDRHRVAGWPLGFDPVENRAGRCELQCGALLTAARAERVGEPGPRQRRLVWRPALAPEPCGFGAEPPRFSRIALREPHPSVSMGRAGD